MSGTRGTPKKGWIDPFLDAFDRLGTVKAACAAAGVGRSTAYRERDANEEFRTAWSEIEDDTTDVMEREAYRRAVEGVERPVFQGGERVGTVRDFSDTLLIFMLKGRKPAMYRENSRVEHTGAGGGAIKVDGAPDLSRLSMDELKAFRSLLAKAGDGGSPEP